MYRVSRTAPLVPSRYRRFLRRVQQGWVDYVFDLDSTKVNTGIVPEVFRHRKGAIRSRHPTLSVGAMGKYAEFLTQRHDEQASAYLPYARLSEIDGKYLAIGIRDRLVGLRHRAQSAAGLLHVVPWFRAVKFRRRDGQTELFTLRDRGGCVTRLPELVSDLRQEGLVQEGVVGQTTAILVPVAQSLRVRTAALRRNPERNLCHKVSCYWCCELERRMDLIGAIDNPRYFQRSQVAIRLISLVNKLRQADSRVVVRMKRLANRYFLEGT